ncbi:unnamed protein product [Cuscuta epithymum]|uniref:Uncharacterized protein n=1 Tax=Cuscuta epithymum TaxID=186058 RepID=A0AAV0FGG6_9ASTE|nr:unnamed protein product [Cuscuta epithymum]
MNLLVSFAPLIPAIIATPRMSPFPISLAETRSNTFLPKMTLQLATATLLLSSLLDTSTIRLASWGVTKYGFHFLVKFGNSIGNIMVTSIAKEPGWLRQLCSNPAKKHCETGVECFTSS